MNIRRRQPTHKAQMGWAIDRREDAKSGSKLDVGSKEESENCLEGGEKLNGICATDVETAVGIDMGEELDEELEYEEVELEDKVKVWDGSGDEEDANGELESMSGDSTSDNSEESERESRLEKEDSDSPSLPEPRLTLALLF